MMGMHKIKRGRGFRGVLNYALGKSEGRIIGGNMTGRSPKELASEYKEARNLRSEVEKPVWHQSLRLPPGEIIDDDKWKKIADDYMNRLGFSAMHQRVYIKHNDSEGHHIHIIANRISVVNGDNLYLGQNENLKSTSYIRELEKDYNLTVYVPDLDNPRPRSPTSGEKGRAYRTGEVPTRMQIQAIIDEAVKDKPSFSDFIFKLQSVGVLVLPNGKSGQVSGVSFELNGHPFTGSSLGTKLYAWKALSARIDYDQDRDADLVFQLRNTIKIKTEQKDGQDRRDEGESRSPCTAENDGFGVSRPGAADGYKSKPDSRGNQGSDNGSQEISIRSNESESGVRQHIIDIVDIRAATADYPRSTNLPDADCVSIDSCCISSVRHVAAQLADIASPISEDRNVKLASGAGQSSFIKPVTREHAAKLAAWEQQSGALNSEKYRITLKPRVEDDSSGRKLYEQNYGNKLNKKDRLAAGIDEKLWSKDEIKIEIVKLRQKNAQGYDIYITPIDNGKHYIVVDDMTEDKYQNLINAGIKPAIVQRSSENNRQAIVVIDKIKGGKEQELANKIVVRLNKQFGDANFTGVEHPFRMAGFSNKKMGKENYLTIVEVSICRLCNMVTVAMQNLRDDEKLKKQEVDKQKKEKIFKEEADKDYISRLSKINNSQYVGYSAVESVYLFEVRKMHGLAKNQGWSVDWSRIDYAVTKILLKSGYDPDLIEKAIIEASPNISDRHRNTEGYAKATVSKASVDTEVLKHLAKQVSQDLDIDR